MLLQVPLLIRLLVLVISATRITYADLSSVFKRRKGEQLLGHSYTELMVRNQIHCAAQCQKDSSCWSANYEKSESKYGQCMLNDGDDISYPNHMFSKKGMSYYRKIIHCGDLPDLCQNGGSCTDSHEGFRCVCPRWLYEGRRCEREVYFYLKHKRWGKYLTATDIPELCCEADHYKVTMNAATSNDSLWKEVTLSPTMFNIESVTTGRFIGYYGPADYVYTQYPAYGAEKWHREVLIETDTEGRRLTNFQNDWSDYIMYDNTDVKGTNMASPDTEFYYTHG